MMTYKIKIRPKALKFIEKQDKFQRLRIYEAIYNLPNGDVKKLVNHKNEYRLRVRWLSNYLWIKSRWTIYFSHKSR
jgi:mRNA-degrading endonuclease RelE of RelBE toxin-antitoxin system